MSCLAIVLQPAQGADILLQTQTWFPTSRARSASEGFRRTRHVDSSLKHAADVAGSMELDRLGDDPLAAASGQVVVGRDQRHRVVYRMVSSVYVLAITSADEDETSINVFSVTSYVNQVVSVLVAACKGVDVTPDKLYRKYPELYLALHYVLRGISQMRLAAVLSSVAGDGSALLLPLPPSLSDTENRARGVASWQAVRSNAVERLACVEVLSSASFELPESTLTAGDAALPSFAPPPTQAAFETTTREKRPKPLPALTAAAAEGQVADPFAASDSLLLGPSPADVTAAMAATQSAPSGAANDPMAQLAGLEVGPAGTSKPAGDLSELEDSADATAVALGFVDDSDDPWDGFGGGGLLGGDDEAWGGGLDAAEFGAEVDELGGLDDAFGGGLLVNDKTAPELPAGGAGDQLAIALGTGEAALPLSPSLPPPPPLRLNLPTFRMAEEISAEFLGSSLLRIRLQGSIFLSCPRNAAAPGSLSGSPEFSFLLEGAAGIHRAVLRNSLASSLGGGRFHVRLPPEGTNVAEEQLKETNLAAPDLLDGPLPGTEQAAANSGGLDGPVATADDVSKVGEDEDQPPEICLLKYRLLPRFTPIPLQLSFSTRRGEDSLSLMIQYVANPFLPGPLFNVTFVLSLPFSPAALRVSPAAALDPGTKELSWHVPTIEPKASPQRLRAQVPMIPDSLAQSQEEMSEEEIAAEEDRKAKELAAFKVRVHFCGFGFTLSGLAITEVSSGDPHFMQGEHSVRSKAYLCS